MYFFIFTVFIQSKLRAFNNRSNFSHSSALYCTVLHPFAFICTVLYCFTSFCIRVHCPAFFSLLYYTLLRRHSSNEIAECTPLSPLHHRLSWRTFLRSTTPFYTLLLHCSTFFCTPLHTILHSTTQSQWRHYVSGDPV